MRDVRVTKAAGSLLVGLAALTVLSGRFAQPLAPGKNAGPFVATAQAAGPDKTNAAPQDPLADLNKAFRVAYARALQEVVRQTDPVILTKGDHAILFHRGQRTEVRVVPEQYHTFKALSHIPLAVYALLAPYGEGEISEARLKDLRDYRARLDGASEALRGLLPEACMDRQRQIITASQRFLAGVVEQKRVKNDELIAFTRKMGPLVLANAAEAARVELDALNKQVQAWKAEMTPEEWRRLVVVVTGSAMPRKGNLDTQYFARLFGEPGEGPRIIYAEGLFEESRALSLLGTYRFDADIGFAFFDDRRRMHRDLLEDAAAEYLKTLSFDR